MNMKNHYKETICGKVMHAYAVSVEYLARHSNNEKSHSHRAFAMLYKCNRAKDYLDSGESVLAANVADEIISEIEQAESAL
jgi:hypothetical protein